MNEDLLPHITFVAESDPNSNVEDVLKGFRFLTEVEALCTIQLVQDEDKFRLWRLGLCCLAN